MTSFSPILNPDLEQGKLMAAVKMRLIYLKNSIFHGLRETVDTMIDVRNETSKHHLLKSVKINT